MPTKQQHDKQRTRIAAERRTHVSALFLEGFPQYEIAKKLDVSVSTISRDLQALHTFWHEESIRNYDEIIREEVLKLDHIEHVAWLGYYESKKEVQTTNKPRPGDDIDKPGQCITETITQKAGDARFLKQIADCVFKKIQLYGAARPNSRNGYSNQSSSQVEIAINEKEVDTQNIAQCAIDAMAKYIESNNLITIDSKNSNKNDHE